MIRLLPVFLLLGFIGVAIFAWTSGIVQNAFDPRIAVLLHSKNMAPGSSLQVENFVSAIRPASKVPAGAIVIGPQERAKSESVASLVEPWAANVYAKEVSKGGFVFLDDFQRPAPLYGIVASSVIPAGEQILGSNARIRQIVFGSSSQRRGEILFSSPEDAQIFLSGELGDVRAGRRIRRNETILLSDLLLSDEKLWILRSSDTFLAGETAPASSFAAESISISQIEVPVPLVFDTEAAARSFLSAGAIVMNRSVDAGSALTPLDIRQASPDKSIAQPSGKIPRNRVELDAWLAANEGLGQKIPSGLVLDGVVGDDKFDIWAETARTEGSYSRVSLVRIGERVNIFDADESSVSRNVSEKREVKDEKGVVIDVVEDVKVITDVFPSQRWVMADPATIKRLDGALAQVRGGSEKSKEKFLFMTPSGVPLSRLMGNGVVCQGWICSGMLGVGNRLDDSSFGVLSASGDPAFEPSAIAEAIGDAMESTRPDPNPGN